jgi:hypothetical protein
MEKPLAYANGHEYWYNDFENAIRFGVAVL